MVTDLQLPVSEIGTLLLNLRNALCFSRPYQTRLIDSTGIFVWMQVSWMICLTIFCSSMYRHFYNPDAKRPAALKGKERKLFPYSNLSILCWKILGTFSGLLPFASLINHEIGRYTHEKNSMEGLTRYSLLSWRNMVFTWPLWPESRAWQIDNWQDFFICYLWWIHKEKGNIILSNWYDERTFFGWMLIVSCWFWLVTDAGTTQVMSFLDHLKKITCACYLPMF